MTRMSKLVNFVIDPILYKKFQDLCEKKLNRSTSYELRLHIEMMVKKYGQT